MQIPNYFLRSLIRHFARIVEYSQYDLSDTRTANAIRLGRKDLSKLNKYIESSFKDNNKNDTIGKI